MSKSGRKLHAWLSELSPWGYSHRYPAAVESNWNRAAEPRSLSLAQINRLINGTSLKAREACLIDEGKANTNYELVLEDGSKAVLRVHQRDPGALLLETAIASRLSWEIPIPRVLAKDFSLGFSVLEWRPGSSMEKLLLAGRLDEVSSAATGIGSALARISTVRFDQAGFLDADLKVASPWASSFDGLFGYLNDCLRHPLTVARLGVKNCRRVEEAWLGYECEIREATAQPCLVHGDFKASNLLIHEGQLSAVLDWEFAHSGTNLMSIGQLFRHENSLPSQFQGNFILGYSEEVGELPQNWKRLARLVDLASLVDFLSRESTRDPMTNDVLALVERTLDA